MILFDLPVLAAISLTDLVSRWGYLAVFCLVAIESAGIPAPGETILVTAAIFAGAGHLSIGWVIAVGAAAAIVGDNLGYLLGRTGGRTVALRYGRYIRLRPEQLDRAEAFFRTHGDKTVFLGRFVAVLRAWVAFLAGVNRMPWPRFVVFNAAGGIVWATGYGLLGYMLGNNLPLLHTIERDIGIGGIVAAVVVVGGAIVVWRWRVARRILTTGRSETDGAP